MNRNDLLAEIEKLEREIFFLDMVDRMTADQYKRWSDYRIRLFLLREELKQFTEETV